MGDHFGWRATFVAVAVATVATTVVTWRLVPETRESTTTSLASLARAELAGLRNVRLLVALATTASFQAAVFCTFSYLAPLLIEVSGVSPTLVPAALLVFGIGSFIGITVGGRYADRNLLGAVFICLGILVVALVVLAAAAPHPFLVWGAVLLFGMAGFSIASAINARVFAHAGAAPTLASAVNVSAFNVGNAVGPWVGGLVIAGGWGYIAPIWASVGLVALALLLATTSWQLERRPDPTCVECVEAA